MSNSRKLSKSNIVQKSFRIDSDLNSALELLSKKVNRSQNDLFNSALEFYLDGIHVSEAADKIYLFDFAEREVRLLIASLNIALEFMENHNDDTSEYEALKSRFTFR